MYSMQKEFNVITGFPESVLTFSTSGSVSARNIMKLCTLKLASPVHHIPGSEINRNTVEKQTTRKLVYISKGIIAGLASPFSGLCDCMWYIVSASVRSSAYFLSHDHDLIL